jgi:hypothetical protein
MFLTNWLNSKECFITLLVGMVASNLSCHILPEVFENDHVANIFVLLSLVGGIFLQYSLHRFLSPAKKSGNQFLLFLHLHNVTDGLTIGLAALNSLSFGLFMALAVMLHDVIHKIIGVSFLRAQGDKVNSLTQNSYNLSKYSERSSIDAHAKAQRISQHPRQCLCCRLAALHQLSINPRNVSPSSWSKL